MTRSSEPILRQRIFEARFSQGYRYLDRCGEAMVILENLLETDTGRVWLPGVMTPTGARLWCPDLDMTIVFDAMRLVVDQNPVGDATVGFDEVCQATLSLIIGKFDLRKMVRWGARRVKILGADSLDAAERLSLRYDVGRGECCASDGFSPRTIESTQVYEVDDRSKGVRLEVKPYAEVSVEVRIDDRLRQPPHLLPIGQREALLEHLGRQRQRLTEPRAGLLIDIDYYVVNPSNLTVPNFMKDAGTEADAVEAGFLARKSK